MTELERELRVYKARYDETDQSICSQLGIGVGTFLRKRKGERPFTVKELYTLTRLLGRPADEVYDLLPAINHA